MKSTLVGPFQSLLLVLDHHTVSRLLNNFGRLYLGCGSFQCFFSTSDGAHRPAVDITRRHTLMTRRTFTATATAYCCCCCCCCCYFWDRHCCCCCSLILGLNFPCSSFTICCFYSYSFSSSFLFFSSCYGYTFFPATSSFGFQRPTPVSDEVQQTNGPAEVL